jgi:4-amino-4-deoxy-L-arabinose transferase-like glycosyltransferase
LNALQPIILDRRFWLLAILFTLLWAVLLAERPLLDPDEGRYAEIPREMLVGGDWVIPHLDGLAYLEKPPLQYWITAGIYSVLGVHEWTARLWTQMASLMTIAAVFVFAARTWGITAGRWAAVMLACSSLFFLLGHQLTLDASTTFFLTLALLAYCRAQSLRDQPLRANRPMLVCWAAMSGAVLSKGLIGLLIPSTVVVLYALANRDYRAWRSLNLRLGVPLFALIVAPWFVLAAHENREFLQFFFVHEHFQRFATRSADRFQPWWYFAAVLAAGALPWLSQTVRAMLYGWRRSTPRGSFDVRRFLWIWCIFVMVFFSASDSKLSPYILPMFPALALLFASERRAPRYLDAVSGIALSAVVALAILVVSTTDVALGADHARTPALLAFQPKLMSVVATFAFGAMLALLRLRSKQAGQALVIVGMTWLLAIVVLVRNADPIEPLLSGKSLALSVPEGGDPNMPVYSVGTFIHSLNFYWRRNLIPVNYRGELALGLDENPRAGIASLQEFETRWIHSSRALAVITPSLLPTLQRRGLPMRIAAQTVVATVIARR